MGEYCNLCPRACNVDRTGGKIGFCGQDNRIKIARADLHMWEEPCISGKRGSGTVFFSGCSLRCIYCQNHEIALGKTGSLCTEKELAKIYLRLQDKGAANINLVTGTHYIPQIRESLLWARENGLTIPVVYNCGGYEKVESIRTLDGLIDIYLPDYKYSEEELAEKFSGARDYPKIAMEAIAEMVRQKKDTVINAETGYMQSGVIVRHLVLPGHTRNSINAIKALHDYFGDKIYISIMSQYTPIKMHEQYPELNRTLTKREYNKVVDFALEYGVENAFIQEMTASGKAFIPEFGKDNIL